MDRPLFLHIFIADATMYKKTIIHLFCPKKTLKVGCFKGQTNSKGFFQAKISSKKRMNKFELTTRRLVFVHFLEESEDTKKTFRN